MITDAIVLSLANRSTAFKSPAFQGLRSFKPFAGADDEDEVRALLDLNPSIADYGLKAVLGAVHACPDVMRAFEEPSRTWSPRMLTRTSDSLTNGDLVWGPDGTPSVSRIAAEWPVVPAMTLTWLDAAHGRMRIGTTDHVVGWWADGETRAVDWPEASGVVGRLRPTTPVVDGYVFTLWHEPVGCPYDVLVSKIEASAGARRLLARMGLTKMHFAADSAVEKVAVTALALGRANRNVYTS